MRILKGRNKRRKLVQCKKMTMHLEIYVPQYLNGLVTAHGGGLGRRKLRHGGFSREIFSRVLELGGAPGQQACLVSGQHHLADLELDHLKVGNRLVKGLSLEGVLDSAIDRSGSNSQGLTGDTDPSTIQRAHANLESLALLSEQVLSGNANIVQDHVGRGRGSDAEFVLLRTEAVTFRTGGNDECGNTLVPAISKK